MKTIGKYLVEARKYKGYCLEDLEKDTKIKKSFLTALEQESWHELPEWPVVVGFVKNIATSLDLDRNQTLSVLRRDYPPSKMRATLPKKEIKTKTNWGPRIIFFVAISFIGLLSLGYIVFQYVHFTAAPKLRVDSPQEMQVVKEDVLKVTGHTDPENTILINNQGVIVEENGDFATDLEIASTTKEIEIVAQSRAGKTTVVKREIKVELKR